MRASREALTERLRGLNSVGGDDTLLVLRVGLEVGVETAVHLLAGVGEGGLGDGVVLGPEVELDDIADVGLDRLGVILEDGHWLTTFGTRVCTTNIDLVNFGGALLVRRRSDVLSRGNVLRSRGNVFRSRGNVFRSRSNVFRSRSNVFRSRSNVVRSRSNVAGRLVVGGHGKTGQEGDHSKGLHLESLLVIMVGLKKECEA